MKRVIIFAVVILLSFTLGYWTRKMFEFAEAMGNDKFQPYIPKTDSATQESHPRKDSTVIRSGSVDENFDDFIERFSRDSLFQLDRIIFPINSVKKSDWKIEKLFGKDEYRPQIYDNFNGELRDTNERLFRKIGMRNGIFVEYRFSKIGRTWYLINLTDFSD